MVHPTELLRTDSTGDEGSFVAPVADYQNSVDCGCVVLPCLTEKLKLERYAKPGCFVAVLSFAALFSGIVVRYFRGTSQVWRQHYDISQDTTDWLLYTNEVFVGLLALILAYWGNRAHRPKWLGALSIYLGMACFMLIIPEIYQPFRGSETDINNVNGRLLCQSNSAADRILDVNNQTVAFATIILYQIIYALFSISLNSHGITYIDDNARPGSGPMFMAMVFSTQRLGKQIGIYSAWMPYIFSAENIFISIIWLLSASNLVIAGVLIAMFPKVLPNTLLRQSVNSLLNIASGNHIVENQQSVDGFCKTLLRILQNKILILNIVAMMFMQAAVVNFKINEKYFNQSKFHVSRFNDVSGFSDPALIQFSSNLLEQPLVAISYVAVGLVIAKVKPRAKLLIFWNIKVYVTILITFAASKFFSCTGAIHGVVSGRLMLPYTSWNCGCSLDGSFQPICLNSQTHFSPCYAGCTTFNSELKLYENCSYPGRQSSATAGSCDADDCSTYWALTQFHSVISAALLGSSFIVTLFITLRSVASKDKALAVGLYLTLVTLVPHLPVRAFYNAVLSGFCEIYGRSTCQLYSDDYTLYISIITICFKVLAIITTIVLTFFIDKIQLYHNNGSKVESDEDLSFLRSNYRDVSHHDSDSEGSSLVRARQLSDSRLNNNRRSSKDDRINTYLSEGDLVPSLNSNLSPKSTSKNSELTNESSLSAIANAVGDDHDSDVSSIQRPVKVKQLENELEQLDETKQPRKIQNGIEETEF